MTSVRAPYGGSAATVPTRRPLVVAAVSGVAAVGLGMWLLSHFVTDRERPLDFGSGAVWTLWATDDFGVVALEPGGEPLPGTWEARDLGRGWDDLRGSPIPREDGPATAGTWRGGDTGVVREIDGVTWLEMARWGGLTDLDEMGQDPSFVGTWRAFAFRVPDEDLRLDADGNVRVAGVPRPVGRWAARDRFLLLHVEGWHRARILRFVRDPDDPSGDRWHSRYGCEGAEIRRVR